jgi:uncharacterized protein
MGGGKVIQQLSEAEYSKHMLLIRGILDMAIKLGHGEANQVRHAYELLAEIQDHHPGVVEEIIRHPAVGAWAMRALCGMTGRNLVAEVPGMRKAAPGGISRLAAAAALKAGVRISMYVPVLNGVLALPTAGRILLPRAEKHVHMASGGEEIDLRTDSGDSLRSIRGLQDIRGWEPIRTIRASSNGISIDIIIDDVDPYRMPSASLAARQTASEFLLWEKRIAESWELLTHYHPSVARDVRGAIRVVTPLRAPLSGVRSATSHEAFGAIGMSLPRDAVTVAVTLAHEVQHAKLCALLDQVALVRPDDGRRFYAPWRTDPRPASGLLQGSYAFLGVAEFWRRQRYLETGDRAVRAHAEFARWRKSALEVADTLHRSGSLTDDGRTFVIGMLETLTRLNAESVPAAAYQLAEHSASEHLAQWHSRYPRPFL